MSRTVRLRVTGLDYGTPGIIRVTGVDEDPANYTNTSALGGSGLTPAGGVGGVPGGTKLALIDSVTLRDADDGPGIYAAALGYASTWPGCVISRSGDNGASYDDVELVVAESTIGFARTALAAPARPYDWDTTNTLDVQLLKIGEHTLTSETDLAVLNGANVAALIDSTGQAEIIQWATATPSSGGRYTLSRLLRARKGSDYAMSAHGVGDLFVVLDRSAIRRIGGDIGEINLERIYKGVSFGNFKEDAPAIRFVNTGASLKPLSPVLGAGSRDGSSHLTVPFIRRTRIGGEWIDYSDVPLGEESELYECDIFSDGTYATVKRTLTGTATAAGSEINPSTHVITYKSADQVTDFGSNQSTVYLKAYQISAVIGRGFAAVGAV